jgi:hypothetical protein
MITDIKCFLGIDLFLIRGLPSSGKSTLADKLALRWIETDQFFVKDNEYKFDPALLPQAHAWCLQETKDQIEYFLKFPKKSQYQLNVIVANTFATRWEMQPYIMLAKQHDLRLTVVDLFDGGCDDETLFARNKHGVPLETFRTMREEYEHDWRNGNPTPPWER